MSPQFRSLIGLVLILVVLLGLHSKSDAYIFPPVSSPSSSPPMQVLGVGGTTLSLASGQSAYYYQYINTGEKIKVEAKNFTGGTVCIYISEYITDTTLAFKCGSTSPISVEYEEKSASRALNIVAKVTSSQSTVNMHLTWTKYVYSVLVWVDKEDGRKKEVPIFLSYGQKVEGTLKTYNENDNWYKLNSWPGNKLYWDKTGVVSLIGSTSTDFDIEIYKGDGSSLIAYNYSTNYPTYVMVRYQNYPFLIRVYPYVLSTKNEYSLSVGFMDIQNYSPSTISVKPGKNFTISYLINSSVIHDIPIVLGATIKKSDEANVFYHDPGNDTTVIVPNGVSTKSRNFYVPKDARLGTYDLELGLYGVKYSNGSVDYNFDWKNYSKVVKVEVPSNPEITYASASPNTLAPGDSTNLTIKWIFYNACSGGCMVYANAFGSWAKTTELCKIYGGVDGNYGNEQTKTCTIGLPQDITPGTHYIRVGFCYAYSYASSYDSLAGCTYRDIPITVKKINTTIYMSPMSFTINSGGEKNFIAQLKDENSNPIANKPIYFSCSIEGGECICSPPYFTTGSDGYAISTCSAIASYNTSMSVTASFPGDYRYSPSSVRANGSVVIPPPQTYQITVNPNGGRIYVDGSPITTTTTYNWNSGSTHTLDPDSGYEAASGVKKIFTQWSDGSTADPRTITVTSSATYTANWKDQYKLTISVSPSGAGTTNPPIGSYWYDQGTQVTVTATASSGYIFDHWELDGNNVGTSPSYTVTMNAPHNLVAVFRSQTPTISITVNPNGGRIYVDGSPITTTTTYNWNSGSTHTLDPDSGYEAA
ncbi:MAG: hypothetical protein QXI54_02760, partial [Archaeoglobaceae archaeon]